MTLAESEQSTLKGIFDDARSVSGITPERSERGNEQRGAG
jgi:hypothetical protein